MSEIKELTKLINKWVDDRNKRRFQTPKDLAISLSLEASEVLEHFQWKNKTDANKHIKENKEELADEIADVMIHLLELAYVTKIDLYKAVINKMKKNEKKYPINKSKGNYKKYTEL